MSTYTDYRSKSRSKRLWARTAGVFLSLVVAFAWLVPPGPAHAGSPAVQLLIDTDPGVDDAAAIVWLLSQRQTPVNVLGIATVTGNTTVDNATNNVLTLLDVLGRSDVPVVMGAPAPLSQPHSLLGMLVHGPDGLWGAQQPHDLSGVSQDAAAFYCDAAVQHPGVTVLTLGPLTNLAQAIQQCPEQIHGLGRIVSMGGSKISNAPQSDYNIWQDPEAADIVLTSGLPVTLVTDEASGQFVLSGRDLQVLAAAGNGAAKFIAGPMQMYAAMQSGFGGETQVAYYDVAAAIYATNSALGTAQSALVKIVMEQTLARGQTVIGLTLAERITMIASFDELNNLAIQFFTDPNFDLYAAIGAILAREPDNAQVVLSIREYRMYAVFMRALIAR
jgi:inosine-uridine nucleoside N-ribohydrolase